MTAATWDSVRRLGFSDTKTQKARGSPPGTALPATSKVSQNRTGLISAHLHGVGGDFQDFLIDPIMISAPPRGPNLIMKIDMVIKSPKTLILSKGVTHQWEHFEIQS